MFTFALCRYQLPEIVFAHSRSPSTKHAYFSCFAPSIRAPPFTTFEARLQNTPAFVVAPSIRAAPDALRHMRSPSKKYAYFSCFAPSIRAAQDAPPQRGLQFLYISSSGSVGVTHKKQTKHNCVDTCRMYIFHHQFLHPTIAHLPPALSTALSARVTPCVHSDFRTNVGRCGQGIGDNAQVLLPMPASFQVVVVSGGPGTVGGGALC